MRHSKLDPATDSMYQVECPDKCGLMLHQILHFDKWHSSVVSTDSRWRRGCTSDGSEITADSEMAGKSLSGDLGQLNCRQTTLTYLYSQAARRLVTEVRTTRST